MVIFAQVSTEASLIWLESESNMNDELNRLVGRRDYRV